MGSPSMLKIDLITDARKVGPGVDAAEGKLSKLASAGKKVALVAGTAMVAGIGLAAKAAWDWSKAAAADEEAQAKLANTLRNAAGATDEQIAAAESWISKMGEQLGIADDELRPALAKLVAVTGDVGKAQKLAALAMDVSAGSGKSLNTVTEALVKAQNGSVGGLSRLGVATKNARGETMSLNQITGRLAKTYKGAATDAANSAGGAQRRLAVRLDELKETIGAKVLPMITRLTTWFLDKALPGAQKLSQGLARNLGPAFASVGRFITGTVIPAARTFYAWYVDKIAPGLKRAVTPVLNGVRDAFSKVQDKVESNRPQLEKLWKVFQTVAEFIANKVAPILGKLAGTHLQVLGSALGGIIDVISRMVSAFDNVIGKVQSLIDWIGRIRMPNIDLPNIPGVGRLMLDGPTGTAASRTAAPVIINVTGALDPHSVARQIRDLLDREARLYGGSGALVA